MVDQGVAATRRVALSNSGALAVCESGQTLREIFGELRQGRVHASLFQGESEMQETLTLDKLLIKSTTICTFQNKDTWMETRKNKEVSNFKT